MAGTKYSTSIVASSVVSVKPNDTNLALAASGTEGFWINGEIFRAVEPGSIRLVLEFKSLFPKHHSEMFFLEFVNNTFLYVKSLAEYGEVLAFDGNEACIARRDGILWPHVTYWEEPGLVEVPCESWDSRMGAVFTADCLFACKGIADNTAFLVPPYQVWHVKRTPRCGGGIFALKAISSTVLALVLHENQGLVPKYWCTCPLPTPTNIVAVAFPSIHAIFWVQSDFSNLPVSSESHVVMARLPDMVRDNRRTAAQVMSPSTVCRDDAGLTALSTNLCIDTEGQLVCIYEVGASVLSLVQCNTSSTLFKAPTLGIQRWWQDWDVDDLKDIARKVQWRSGQAPFHTLMVQMTEPNQMEETAIEHWSFDVEELFEHFIDYLGGPDHIARRGFGQHGQLVLCAVFEDPESPSYAVEVKHRYGTGYLRLDDLRTLSSSTDWLLSSYTSLSDCMMRQCPLRETELGQARDLLKADFARDRVQEEIFKPSNDLEHRLTCVARMGVLPRKRGTLE
ncbi:hypothetical protein DACRYDRAFT_112441 [Dacryopinax primogenitus]|uniref:Uncharacterized protein n=1 Tax=Dacryopinax primogenitus (strain DJM 731) TaxID=1858805 RepID=M5FQ94_DACPD|nr:uncharacterized protein DACRYDRAFT_112441 [Dacryopinax primogenitus]EJT96824.1 hypothetical protein DACRYDRAFT_112441 [Dacryopinax primogenitus]